MSEVEKHGEWKAIWKELVKNCDDGKYPQLFKHVELLESQLRASLEREKSAKEMIDRLEKELGEVQKDITETASDTVWTHDCVSMTCVERIQICLEDLASWRKENE